MPVPRPKLLALLLAALCAVAGAALAQGDDEILTEFKRYFRKYKDTPTRIEAVLALEGCELPEMVSVLAPLYDQAEYFRIERFLVEVVGAHSDRPYRVGPVLVSSHQNDLRIGSQCQDLLQGRQPFGSAVRIWR